MRTVFLALSALAFSVVAQAGSAVPPASIERATYSNWLSQIGAPSSPYSNFLFSWLEEQGKTSLPSQVSADPEKLFVAVERPLAEAVRVEAAGDLEEGTSYGLETYAIINAPVSTVLETILFRWGKPVGQAAGATRPYDTVYGFREERANPEWGPGSYRTITSKRNGGIAGDMNDSFSLLVRGNPQEGFVIAGSFIAPTGETITTSFLTFIILRPMADGKTEYRVAGLLTGQNYSFFGLENGRKNFGFNAARIREGQKEFIGQVKALKDTGKIPERR